MKKFPKIKRFGHESTAELLDGPVTVVEKMDGASFRFTHSKNVDGVDEERLVFGSRNVVYKNETDTDKAFQHAIEYVRERVPPDKEWWERHIELDGDAITIFGEAMHSHTIDYDWDTVPDVLLFDAYADEFGWLLWNDIKTISRITDIEHAPTVANYVEIDNADQIPIPDTSAYRDGFPEGVVLRRNNGSSITRAKYRTEEFLERHSSASKTNQGGDPEDDSIALARKLLGKENWVEKHIHKYEDKGQDIEMEMMETLWRDVFDDIIEEEHETIFLSNHTIDTKDFRSEIASQTAEILQAYIQRPEGSTLNE